jgi:hypothetical protein
MLPLLLGLIGPISGLVNKILDKTVSDKDLNAKLKSEALAQLMNQDNEEFKVHLKEAGSIIRAEANSESWISRSWRPIIMLLFGVIIANNYVLFPYINMFFPDHAVLLPIPSDLWALLKIGIGGYVVSRGAEKTMRVYREKKND